MQQVLSADRELWSLIFRDSCGILKFYFAGAEPHLDRLIVKLHTSPQVFCFASLLPGSTAGTLSKPQPVATKQNAQAPKRLIADARGPELLPKN